MRYGTLALALLAAQQYLVESAALISTGDGRHLCTEKPGNGTSEIPIVSVCNASKDGTGPQPQQWSWSGLQLKTEPEENDRSSYCLEYVCGDPIKLTHCDPHRSQQEFCSSGGGLITQTLGEPWKFLGRVMDEQSCIQASADGLLNPAYFNNECYTSDSKWYADGVEIQLSSLDPPPCSGLPVAEARIIFCALVLVLVVGACACCYGLYGLKKTRKAHDLPMWTLPVPPPLTARERRISQQSAPTSTSTSTNVTDVTPSIAAPPVLHNIDTTPVTRFDSSMQPAILLEQRVVAGPLDTQTPQAQAISDVVQLGGGVGAVAGGVDGNGGGGAAPAAAPTMKMLPPAVLGTSQLQLAKDSIVPLQSQLQQTQVVTVTSGVPGTQVQVTGPDGSVSATVQLPAGIAPNHSVSICVPTVTQPRQEAPITLPAIDLIVEEVQERDPKLKAPPALSGMSVFGFRGHCPFVVDGTGAEHWIRQRIDVSDLNLHFNSSHPYAVYVADDQSGILQSRVNEAIAKERSHNAKPASKDRMRFERRSCASTSTSSDAHQQPDIDQANSSIPAENSPMAPRVHERPSMASVSNTQRSQSTNQDSTPRCNPQQCPSSDSSDSTPRCNPQQDSPHTSVVTFPSPHGRHGRSGGATPPTEKTGATRVTKSAASRRRPTPPEDLGVGYGTHPKARNQACSSSQRSSTQPPEEMDTCYDMHPSVYGSSQGSSTPPPEEVDTFYGMHPGVCGSSQRSSTPPPEEMDTFYGMHPSIRPGFNFPTPMSLNMRNR